MKIGLYRREHLQSGNPQLVGDATSEQFQRTHGAINAWQEVEHDDDGHHTNITADSIVVDGPITADSIVVDGVITADSITVAGDVAVSGDVTVGGSITAGEGVSGGEGGFSGENGQVGIGDLPADAAPGQPPQSPGYGVKIGPWRIISDAQNSPGTPTLPSLAFQFLNEAVGAYLFRVKRLAAYDWALNPFAGVSLRLGTNAPGDRITSIDTTTLGVSGTATMDTANVSASANVTGQVIAGAVHSVAWMRANDAYYETPSRAVAMGYWQDVPYSAGLFAAYSGAWTVPNSPGNYRYRYTIIGKTLHVSYVFAGTTVGGAAPNVALVVVSPPGLTFGAGLGGFPIASVAYALNVGAFVTTKCFIQILSGNQWGVMLPANWAIGGGTAMYGSFTVEIM